MPRTKKVNSIKSKIISDMGAEKGENTNFNLKEHLLKLLLEQEQSALDQLGKMKEDSLVLIRRFFIELTKDIPAKYRNKPLSELMNTDFENTLSQTFALSGKSMNSTRALSKSRHQTTNSTVSSVEENKLEKTRTISKTRRTLRSMSAGGADEGYTSESTRATNSGASVASSSRQSRSRVKTAKPAVSRSLSRSIRTPLNRCPPSASTGSITPKCKTSAPLMWGRRPRIGEVGWSNQGSPLLLTGVLAPEQTATINIPMGNGDLVSLQPTTSLNALKQSDLPPLEAATKDQLLALRDTLIRICTK